MFKVDAALRAIVHNVDCDEETYVANVENYFLDKYLAVVEYYDSYYLDQDMKHVLDIDAAEYVVIRTY